MSSSYLYIYMSMMTTSTHNSTHHTPIYLSVRSFLARTEDRVGKYLGERDAQTNPHRRLTGCDDGSVISDGWDEYFFAVVRHHT